MPELLDELAPAFGEPKIFRPYRDVRFSKDKSPYKTNIGAVVGDGYIQLSASGLAAGTWMFGMAPDQLDRDRLSLAGPPARPVLEHVDSRTSPDWTPVAGRRILIPAPPGGPVRPPRATP